jgi:hypothetical protein
MLPCQRTLFSP